MIAWPMDNLDGIENVMARLTASDRELIYQATGQRIDKDFDPQAPPARCSRSRSPKAGGLVAVREGGRRAGEITLDGCPALDAYLGLIGALPVTTGIVRRVRVVQVLHDLGTDQWIRRTGAVRLIDVPDAGPERLFDDPSFFEPMCPG